MTLKSDAKFEEKLALGSKNDMMNLVNFNASSGKFSSLMCYFCRKYIMFEPNKSKYELCFTTLKNDAKFEEEIACTLKNDMRTLASFDPTLRSLKTFTLISSFWPKYIMFQLKNYRGVICHDTEGWWNKLREECPYSELFWSAFSRIFSPYSARIRENADQNNTE